MQCPNCGYIMQPFEDKCPRCARLGPPQPATPPAVSPAAPPAAPTFQPIAAQPGQPSAQAWDVEYAGFWRRFAAAFIDGILVSIAGTILERVARSVLGEFPEMAGAVIQTILGWLYFTLMESSSSQATWGKSALGIAVTDMNGDRISWGRANARYWSKLISGLILLIGYLMAGFTQKKQALHDMIAGTLVVKG